MNPVRNKLRYRLLGLLLPVLVALPGCRTWYKPGAGGEQLADDRQQCELTVGRSDAQAVSDCLYRAGWRQSGAAASTTGTQPRDGAASGVNTEQAAAQPAAWFKVGADAAQMADALRLCQADTGTLLSGCMNAKGWYAIGARPRGNR